LFNLSYFILFNLFYLILLNLFKFIILNRIYYVVIYFIKYFLCNIIIKKYNEYKFILNHIQYFITINLINKKLQNLNQTWCKLLYNIINFEIYFSLQNLNTNVVMELIYFL